MTDTNESGTIDEISFFECKSYKTRNWAGEFQGGENDMATFQFQKPPGEFDGRIR